jgi:hypothetical protein
MSIGALSPPGKGVIMPVMGFTRFEQFFRAASEIPVDRDDIKRYLN